MKYEVVDNFLPTEFFDRLVRLFTGREIEKAHRIPWYFNSFITSSMLQEGELFFYMVHMFYNNNMPISSHYNELVPLLEKLKVKCLLRIKANLYPNTTILHEHAMHTDYEYSHSGAILSLNTCDGYTKLKDGTKIDSVANRVLLFDASNEHCSSTTTNDYARFNININYIQEQYKEQKKGASTQTFDY